MKRLLMVASASCTLLLIAWLSIADAQDQQVPSATTGNGAPDLVVGTWKGQHGRILNLRADGTARSWPAEDKADINYYDYRLLDKQLVFYYAADPDDYLRRLKHAIFGMTAVSFDLVELGKTKFELLDPATGDTYVYLRAEDSVLADAP